MILIFLSDGTNSTNLFFSIWFKVFSFKNDSNDNVLETTIMVNHVNVIKIEYISRSFLICYSYTNWKPSDILTFEFSTRKKHVGDGSGSVYYLVSVYQFKFFEWIIFGNSYTLTRKHIMLHYRGQDSPSPNSILSSQVARQRTTSATANSNSGTSLPSSTSNSNVAAQVAYVKFNVFRLLFWLIICDNQLDQMHNNYLSRPTR